MSNSEHAAGWDSLDNSSAGNALQASGQSSAGSGSGSEVSSVILHNSAYSEDLAQSQSSESQVQETPGRPEHSVSEYADAYVKLMEARESAQLESSALTNSQEHPLRVSVPRLDPPPGHISPPLPSPTSSSSSPNASLRHSQNASSHSPRGAQQSTLSPTYPRQPSSASYAPSASPSMAPRRDSPDASYNNAQNGNANRAASNGSQHHGRRHSSPYAHEDDLDERYNDEEDDMYEESRRPQGQRGHRRSPTGPRGGNARNAANVASSSNYAQGQPGRKGASSLANSNAPGGSRQQQQAWHSRKNSTASAGSSGSDSPHLSNRPYDSPRAYDAPREVGTTSGRTSTVGVTAGGITYAPVLKRSLGSSGHPASPKPDSHIRNYGTGNTTYPNDDKPTAATIKSTLHYLRRRIHALRGLSFGLLIILVVFGFPAWLLLIAPLAASQQKRLHGCARSISIASEPTNNAAAQPECNYFYHDMTAFIAVSGIWVVASIVLAIVDVSASFMFYWRKLTTVTLVGNLSMLVLSAAMLNWAIIALSFAHEPENWRIAPTSTPAPPSPPEPSSPFFITFPYSDSHPAAKQLKVMSIAFLVAVSLFWLFSFFIVISLTQLRKYIMSKPRYCCWPLEGFCCTPVQRTPTRRPHRYSHEYDPASPDGINNGDKAALGGDGGRHAPGVEEGFRALDDDDQRHLALGSEDVRSQERAQLMPPRRRAGPQRRVAQSPPPGPDLSPLLASLQGIQSTVNSLAQKVQTIEQREAASGAGAAPSAYSDPFAYGRQPPPF